MTSLTTSTQSSPGIGPQTNLGPLMTVFAVPSSCTDVTSWSGGLFAGRSADMGDPNCYPSSTTKSGTSEFYSPGICPSGWTGATTYPPDTKFPSSTTASLCCPTGWNWWSDGGNADFGHVCFSDIQNTLSNVWVPSAIPTGTYPASRSLETLNLAGQKVLMDGVVVLWESTDTAILALLSSESNTGTTSSTSIITSPATTASSGSSSSSVPKQTSASSSSGLSEPAKVAVGVTIPVALIAAIVLSMAYIVVRRRRQKTQPSRANGNHQYRHPELQGQERYEVHAENKPVELQTMEEPVELQSNVSARPVASPIELPG